MHRVIRVVIADDHGIVRQGVKSLLSAQTDMAVVAEATTGPEVIERVVALDPDVVVLDLSLPELNGIEVLTRLREAGPRPAVVVLTMYPEDQMAWHLLSLGAHAYLNKTRPPEELLAAVRAVARAGRYVTSELRDLAFEHQLDAQKPHHRLTTREYQVFLLLTGGRTVNEIGTELAISASTVSNHVTAIRTKLGARSIADVVVYAHRAGLL